MITHLKLAEKIGLTILDREYQAYREYIEDDSEYIPRVKRLIDSVSAALVADGCGKDECKQLEQRLYNHAKGQYLKIWMIHAEEQEGPGNVNVKAEQKRAYKTFDEHYVG